MVFSILGAASTDSILGNGKKGSFVSRAGKAPFIQNSTYDFPKPKKRPFRNFLPFFCTAVHPGSPATYVGRYLFSQTCCVIHLDSPLPLAYTDTVYNITLPSYHMLDILVLARAGAGVAIKKGAGSCGSHMLGAYGASDREKGNIFFRPRLSACVALRTLYHSCYTIFPSRKRERR